MTAEEIHHMAYNALNTAVAEIQDKLGVEHGDFAGAHFTGEEGERFDQAVQMLEDYTREEIAWNEWAGDDG